MRPPINESLSYSLIVKHCLVVRTFTQRLDVTPNIVANSLCSLIYPNHHSFFLYIYPFQHRCNIPNAHLFVISSTLFFMPKILQRYVCGGNCSRPDDKLEDISYILHIRRHVLYRRFQLELKESFANKPENYS